MKRLLALILAILMVFCLVACSKDKKTNAKEPEKAQEKQEQQEEEQEEEEEQESEITPILYRVTDEEGNEVYLFGSIHVGQEYFYPLPDYVLDAYEKADALAVEFDILAFEEDTKAQTEMAKLMLITDGTSVKDYIPQELYDRAVAYLEDADLYMSMLDYFYPFVWTSFVEENMIAELGLDTELGIDRYFLNRAKEEDKPIMDIESAEFQYGMLAGFSEPLQILLLEEALAAVEDMDAVEEDMMKLVDLWASGDEEGLVEYLYEEADLEEDEIALYVEYNTAMITDRNLGMADFAEEALASGDTVFIVVGAAHIVGPDAMADLLAQRGYTVERVQ